MRIIDWKQLKSMQPYSRQHIARLEAQNRFPRRVRLGNGPRTRCGWVHDEVTAWLEERANRREPSTSS